jgi:hypothetical protein
MTEDHVDQSQHDDFVVPPMNFLFLEVSIELSALNDYWKTVEHQLPTLKDDAEYRLFEKWIGPEPDEHEVSDISTAATTFAQYELPRMFRSTTLVILWAIFESAARQAAFALQQRKNLRLRVSDIKGGTDLDSLSKYYTHILQFPLVTDPEALKELDKLEYYATP